MCDVHLMSAPEETPSASGLNLPRRRFLKKCAAIAATTGLPAWAVESRLAQKAEASAAAASALNRPHIALVGCGGMGKWDATNSANYGDVVAVCDVDGQRAAGVATELTKDGKVPEIARDFRAIMARDDIDVIVNATPDHWHSLVNIAAAKAGKDVYAEKPLTLTIGEGRRVVEAVESNGIVLQTGTQQRSSIRFRMARDLVQSGRIGKLRKMDVWLPAGLRDGPFAPKAAPDHLNWDFWQGPTRLHSYVEERGHANFRFWYDYSGGTITDWGAHHIDIAIWVANQNAPARVTAKALVDPIPGGYTAISEYDLRYTFPNGLDLNVHTTKADSIYGAPLDPDGQRHGILFTGESGWIWVNRGQIKASSPEVLRRDPEDKHSHRQMTGDHMTNFFDCVHDRQKPVCHAEIGHRSASMCHVGVIALRTGLSLEWDAAAERFTGAHAAEANTHLDREMRAPYNLSFIG